MLTLGSLGIAGLVAFASTAVTYIKTWVGWVHQFFVQEVEITDSLVKIAAIDYFRNNYKPSPLRGKIMVSASTRYMPSKKRYMAAPQESGVAVQTLFKNKRPIQLKVTADSDGYVKTVSFSFLRGTYDLHSIMHEMMEEFYQSLDKTSYYSSAYQVYRLFGSRGKDGGQVTETTANRSIGVSLGKTALLGYQISDFGVPIGADPFDGLVMAKPAMRLVELIAHWKNSKEWYATKSIPWRTGILLYGPPGTGKSSFVSAVAKKFDLPVYSFDLTTFSNQDLQQVWKDKTSRGPCICLFEDIDRIFDDKGAIINQITGAQLTLDAILTCIQGVENGDGTCVIATANEINKLPAALGVPDETGKSTRPGRLDNSIYFGPLDVDQRTGLAVKILSDVPHEIDGAITAGEGYTGAQFVKFCADIALDAHWKKINAAAGTTKEDELPFTPEVSTSAQLRNRPVATICARKV